MSTVKLPRRAGRGITGRVELPDARRVGPFREWRSGLDREGPGAGVALRAVVTDVRRFFESAGMDADSVLASGRGGYQLQLPPGSVIDLDNAREDAG